MPTFNFCFNKCSEGGIGMRPQKQKDKTMQLNGGNN